MDNNEISIIRYIEELNDSTNFNEFIENYKLFEHPQLNFSIFQLYGFIEVSSKQIHLMPNWGENYLLNFLEEARTTAIVDSYIQEIITLFKPDAISNELVQLPSLLSNLLKLKSRFSRSFNNLHFYYNKQQHSLCFYPDDTNLAFKFNLPITNAQQTTQRIVQERLYRTTAFVDNKNYLFTASIELDTNIELLWSEQDLDNVIKNWTIRNTYEEVTTIRKNRKGFLGKYRHAFPSAKTVAIPIINNISISLGTTVDNILINSVTNKMQLNIHSQPFEFYYFSSPSGFYTYIRETKEIVVDKELEAFKQKLSKALVKVLLLSFKSSYKIE